MSGDTPPEIHIPPSTDRDDDEDEAHGESEPNRGDVPTAPQPPPGMDETAWRAGFVQACHIFGQNAARLVNLQTNTDGKDGKDDEDGKDGSDETECPECGGTMVDAFGGTYCKQCGHHEDGE